MLIVALSVASVSFLVSLAAVVIAKSARDMRLVALAEEARHELGKKYARIAWEYASANSDSVTPEKHLRHAQEAFRIIDAAVDGTRDFTEPQMSVYLSATRP